MTAPRVILIGFRPLGQFAVHTFSCEAIDNYFVVKEMLSASGAAEAGYTGGRVYKQSSHNYYHH
jgi:hypothetical protein